ncbi:MAG: TlpA family protein disulfide reductase [Candidatus Kapaibacteriales bacterium]
MKNYFFNVILIVFLSIFTFTFCHSQNKELVEEKQNEYFDISELSENARSENNLQSVNFSIEKPRVAVTLSVTPSKPGNFVEFTLEENGKTKKFSEIAKNKIVLLNFWGTWCPPCRREIPDLVQIHNESGGKDYVVVGIALERDINNAEKLVSDFAQKNNIGYLNVIDKNFDIAKAYGGINAVPTTFIIDKNGKIVETLVGMRSKSVFLEAINRARKK